MPISDPPSARLRAESSAPRRRSTDPSPRRRETDHKPANGMFGAFLTAVVAILFLGYVFNILGFATAADQLVSGWNASAQSQNDLVVHLVAMLYPLASLMVVAFVAFGVLRFLMGGWKKSQKGRKLANRDVITLDSFKRITEARGIRPRIATQAYELMRPFYASSMRARLEDRLRDDLHMTPAQIQDVYSNLLRNTDRKMPVGAAPQIDTIMDLLMAVQSAKRQSLMNSVVRPAARTSGLRPARSTNDENTETLSR